MNRCKIVGYCLGLLPAVLICRCSLPAKVEPLRWNMNLQLPVTDQRYHPSDLFPRDAVPGMTLRYGNDTITGDTVTIVKSDSLRYTIEKRLVTTDTSTDEKTFGAQTLENTPFVNLFFGLNETIGRPASSEPLPDAVPITDAKDEPLDGIESVTIDSTSPDLQITVRNVSGQTAIEDIIVTLLDNGDTLGSISEPSLDARSETVAPLSLTGKTIHNPITVALTAVIPAGATVEPDDGLTVAFSLDGQIVASAVIVDSMFSYSDIVTGIFSLADSIDLTLVDLDDALLLCNVTNPTGLMVSLDGVINNTWEYSHAVEHDLLSIEDLASHTDSSGFAGHIIDDTLFQFASGTEESISIPLRYLRLFPNWDTASQTSALSYQYTVHSLSDGRLVHFDKNDTFIFNLIPSRFPFIRVKGTFIEPTEESFSSRRSVSFGWDSSITNSLREAFRFNSAVMTIDMTAELPDSSSMDSLLVHMAINGAGNDSVVKDEAITDITPGTLHSMDATLATILNAWPDSIGFNAEITLPAGTGIDLYNEKNRDGTYKSTLSIGVAVNYSLAIPFCWKVLDTIRTELEQSSFTIDAETLEWIRDIEDPSIRLKLDATNNTNLMVQLFAIGAAEEYRSDLDAFPGSEIGTESMEDELGDHLFSLFGDNGVTIPARGEESTATIQFESRGIDALLSDQECLIRWFLVLPTMDTDAFTTTDYIDLTATAIIEGIGNSDSLLYEDN